MRTFHEQIQEGDAQVQPIRVSYHGRNHYNAIVPTDWDPVTHRYIQEVEGIVESQALQLAEEHGHS